MGCLWLMGDGRYGMIVHFGRSWESDNIRDDLC